MGFIYAVRSEQVKTKHTPFWAIHFCIPAIGALLFLAYYSQYGSTADSKKLKMILEITTTFFPLLISVIVGLNVALEEKASHFQTLLAAPNRHKNMLAKLTYLYGSGIFALFFLFLLFVIGIHLLKIADTVPLGTLIKAAGIAFCNLIIYIFHLFLSYKFGLGLSLFWGVFESLQCILYSNIELKGITRFIPFSWSMNWVQDILSRQIFNYGTGTVYIEVQKPDNFLQISIIDEGSGFTPEALHHAQEQFFMGNKSRTSNMHFGMGLYITSSIIKQHNGQLILKNSDKTNGAQVIIKIPY